MKKQIIKTVSCILVFVVSVLILSSCGIIESYIDSYIDAHTNQRSENEMYGAVKVLYSYEEVMDALSIVRKRVEVDPVYTVYDMGENYTVLYYFIRDGRTTEYPLDYDDYFNSISNGNFTTFIFINDLECPSHQSYGNCARSMFRINKYDEDYERLVTHKKCAGAMIFNNNYSFVEIEDPSFLYYKEFYDGENGVSYYVYYGDKEVFRLGSCIKLEEEFFDLLFENLVTTEAKE